MKRKLALGAATTIVIGAALFWQQLPVIGAGMLIHSARRAVTKPPPEGCAATDFGGAGVLLRGWTCAASGPPRGTIVYLHGVGDNRESAAGVIRRFGPRHFTVVAYDSRSHGKSDGDVCTYGFYEKADLARVIETLPDGPVILFGTSLGAAVALQEAPDDPRVTAVIAAETFSDLRTVAIERAPFVFTRGNIDRAFALAETQAHFRVDDVNPARAATRITVPVLLIHGAADVETPPAHSERVHAALKGPSELILVPGAHHNESLSGADVWARIDAFVNSAAAVTDRRRQGD